MTLYEIRKLVENSELAKANCRSATRDFVRSIQNDYQVALTLTLKQTWFNKNGQLSVQHYLSVHDIPIIYERFQHQLNKLVYKNQYTRYEQSLKFFRAWEDGWGSKRKHLHAAIGNFPKGFKYNTLPSLIEKASRQCYEIDTEHKEEICDGGWMEYITKEVGKHDTDKILW
jgi:hypothetical protein